MKAFRQYIAEERTPRAPKRYDSEKHLDRARLRTVIAHDNELKKRRAEAHNWGAYQGGDDHHTEFGSKTSKGWLATHHDHKTGKITHSWDD